MGIFLISSFLFFNCDNTISEIHICNGLAHMPYFFRVSLPFIIKIDLRAFSSKICSDSNHHIASTGLSNFSTLDRRESTSFSYPVRALFLSADPSCFFKSADHLLRLKVMKACHLRSLSFQTFFLLELLLYFNMTLNCVLNHI